MRALGSSTQVERVQITPPAGLCNEQYDGLFSGPPHLLSRLYAETLQVPSSSEIKLVSSSITPERFPLPNYPPIGRAAHVEGAINLRALISEDGKLHDVTRISGPPLLALPTANTIKVAWLFDKKYAGRTVDISFQFDLNCNASRRDPDLAR